RVGRVALQAGSDARHRCRGERPGPIADAFTEVRPVDNARRGPDVRLHDAFAGRAPVVVLLPVFPPLAAVAPGLDGLDLAALLAVGGRAGSDIGGAHAFADEHDVDPVSPLRRRSIVGAAEVCR